MLRIHATKHFFPAFRIHGCEFAHQLIARPPLRVLAATDSHCQQRGENPNRNVGGGHPLNKQAKTIGNNASHVKSLFARQIGCEREERCKFDAALADTKFSHARPQENSYRFLHRGRARSCGFHSGAGRDLDKSAGAH